MNTKSKSATTAGGYEFKQPVLKCGYRWIEAEDYIDGEKLNLLISKDYELASGWIIDDGPWLDNEVDSFDCDLSKRKKYYQLFPTYRDFIRLDGMKSIIEFANTYGMLGGISHFNVTTESGHTYCRKPTFGMPYGIMPSGRLRFLGEKYEDWVYAIRDLAEAVELWDLLNPSPNSAELKKRITRPKEVYALDIGPKPSSLWDLHRREYVPKPSLRYNYREIASPIIRPELIDEFPNGVIKVAKITLANMITGKLRCYVAQELSVTAESEYHLFAYSQKPSCLLGALWLQLVDEVMGFKIGKICERERCGQHFIMADSRSKYCSRSCNTLAHVVR